MQYTNDYISVGIDARHLFRPGQMIGIRRFVFNLVKYLILNNVNITLFTDKVLYWPPELPKNSIRVASSDRISDYFIWEMFFLNSLLKKHPVRIYHATYNHGIPLFYKGFNILSLHDVIPLLFPNYYSGSVNEKINHQLYKISLRNSVKKADCIITTSDQSKADIIRFFPDSKYKIKKIYYGSELSINKNDKNLNFINIQQTLKISNKYFVYFGGFDPRKNIHFLIKVFKKFVSTFPSYQLVLIGKKNQYYKKFLQKCNSDYIIFTDYLSDSDFQAVVKNAISSIYPSIYEGFGLPILESMRLGTPVISSNSSSLKEVAGDAALLFDPYQPEELFNAMKNIVINHKLRKKLIALGKLRSDKFSWKNTTNEILDTYRKILQNNSI